MRCFFILQKSNNDESYCVSTCWGRFRLDRGAYEDYLSGKLWITWVPGQRNQQTAMAKLEDSLPPDVSENAIRLRDMASRKGLYVILQATFPGRQAAVPYKERMGDKPIDELMLSVRSFNGLMRVKADTFGRLSDLISQENGLRSVRNLGAKSEAEIKRCFYDACYLCLSPNEQAAYWQEIINGMEQSD